LNHARYEAEVKAGLHDAKRKKKGGGRKTKNARTKKAGGSKKEKDSGQMSLF
jgi:hypothetical protein